MVYGCSSSPTGAVTLTLYFLSSVHSSNPAGWVVSLKLIAIRTEVELFGARAAEKCMYIYRVKMICVVL